MAQVKLTFACLVLVLIFCREIQNIEGRHLKLERQNEFQKIQNNLHGGENTNVTIANANVSRAPTTPRLPTGGFPSPPHDDFRPTAPGHSPRVGHAINSPGVGHGDENTSVTVANANVSGAPTTPRLPIGGIASPPRDDFRPTAPGHSPGVGHAIQN